MVANLEFSNICYSGHVTRGSASSLQISHYSDKQLPKNDFIYYGVNPPSWIWKILIFRHVSIFETKIRVFLYQIQSKSDDSRSIYLKKNTFKVAAVRYRRYRSVIAYEIPLERNPVSM